ncbi:unnamed protein product, partial [Iphiclides podalirius]
MSDLEDEIKVLKETNNELVQKVQYWKMTAAQRENEKLELMKEINELRLKLSRIRSGGAAQVRQLDAALQAASQEALTHLVQASSAVARTMDLAKAYMRDRQELDAASPRWSSISGTPASEKVNRVPPMLIGGQSIQPVVSLSRTLVYNRSTRTLNRSPNQQTRNVTERAVPIHMLQDLYIPLTRIDATETLRNMETDAGSNNRDDSTEDLGLDDSSEHVIDESQNMSDIDEFENSRRLEAVTEDLEPEDEEQTPPSVPRTRSENPLEGPSWLLDIQNTQPRREKFLVNLEPDSTTELQESGHPSTASPAVETQGSRLAVAVAGVGCEFSPTVRRRKRTSSPPAPAPAPAPGPATPHYSPRPNSTGGRVLKVMVAKLRLEENEEGSGDASPPKRAMRDTSPPNRAMRTTSPPNRAIPNTSPPKRAIREPSPAGGSSPSLPDRSPREPCRKDRSPRRLMRFDAPSPNGATDARVIVSETKSAPCGSGEPSGTSKAASGRDTSGTRVTDRDTRVTDRDTRDTERDTRDTERDTRDTSTGSRRDRMSRRDACESDARDSDSSTERTEGRTRRPRKAVTYKEKPLNRKLRR